MSAKVSKYYNGATYSMLLLNVQPNLRVGCLASPNDKKFDSLAIGDMATIQGKIHHIQLNYNGNGMRELILAHGCTVSK